MTRERHGVLDPGMRYLDLGPDYERQAAIRRTIAYHVREIEALGLDVTSPAPHLNGRTSKHSGRLTTRHLSRWHKPPSAAAACPAEVLFSGQL